MSTIIHKALFQKLEGHGEWRRFRESFRTLSGLEVDLLEGLPEEAGHYLSATIDVRGVLVGVLAARKGGCGGAHESASEQFLHLAAERFSSVLAESHVHDHKRLPPVVVKTCRWIRSRALAHEVRLSEAASNCGLSPSHLSRLFHHSTGLTFQNYVRLYRLERACELLAGSDLPITRIVFDTGFQSISQFHRSFRAVYGERPTDYRKRMH